MGPWIVLAAIASLGACAAPASTAADASTDADLVVVDAQLPGVRVATVNLRCLLEDWDLRVPLIVAELAALEPDVIALQEVCREDGTDALDDLRQQLDTATGAQYQSARADTHLAWDRYQEGIALLSRLPMSDVQIVDLPVGIFPRKAVVARIDTFATPMQVAVTHLSFGDQAAVRASQLGALRDVMQSRQTDEVLLIAGDLNEGPNGDAIVAATDAAYQDTWALLHPNNDGPTYPSDAPTTRIDYILFSSSGTAIEAREVQRFLHTPTDGRYPSDHVALWAEFGTGADR
jgi:endonuclease/exonuclease/phosphatase family metal-dependent hydrolase